MESCSPLEAAVYRHHFELADYLLSKGADIDGGQVKGQGLYIMVTENNLAGVAYLLSHGANPDERIAVGDGTYLDPPLLFAVDAGQLEMVQLLIENGANPDNDANGYNALHMAVSWGGNYMLKYLLPHTKGINQQTDSGGETPLMILVARGDYPAVKMLLAYHPDLDLKNAEGKTALDIAEEHEYEDIVRLLKNRENL